MFLLIWEQIFSRAAWLCGRFGLLFNIYKLLYHTLRMNICQSVAAKRQGVNYTFSPLVQLIYSQKLCILKEKKCFFMLYPNENSDFLLLFYVSGGVMGFPIWYSVCLDAVYHLHCCKLQHPLSTCLSIWWVLAVNVVNGHNTKKDL